MQYSDDDIEWLSERVRFYLREKHFTSVPRAIDRAKADFQRRLR